MKKTENDLKKENKNLISQPAAAKIAGVTRQAINGLKDKYDFFVGSKVDINSQAWQSYLYERGIKSAADAVGRDSARIEHGNVGSGKSIPADKKNKTKKRPESRKESDKFIPQTHESSERQKHALTGGVNPSRFIPMNLADVERMAKIQNLNLQMRTRLGELVERDMVERVIDVISQTIQSHFVDMPRKVSGMICKKLDRVGAEKEVEKILSGPVAKGISEMKKISLASIELKRLKEERDERGGLDDSDNED